MSKLLDSSMETADLSINSQNSRPISPQDTFNNIKNANTCQGKLQQNKECYMQELDLPLRAVFHQIPQATDRRMMEIKTRDFSTLKLLNTDGRICFSFLGREVQHSLLV